LIKGIRNFRRK